MMFLRFLFALLLCVVAVTRLSRRGCDTDAWHGGCHFCMVSFVEGDTELAKCASKVQEMLAVCGGYSYLVASNSSYIKDYAKVCEKVCNDCAKECREHEEHVECRNCAEACDDLIDAIKLSV